MNPFMFVNWKNAADFFNAAMWVAAALMAILVICLYIAPSSPTVPPRHGQPPVIVGR